MNAYLVIDVNITDVDEFMKYVQRIPALIEKHSGRYIVQGEKPEVIEGETEIPQHTVVLEFPSREQVKSFLSERENSDLHGIWAKSTNSRILLVDGCV